MLLLGPHNNLFIFLVNLYEDMADIKNLKRQMTNLREHELQLLSRARYADAEKIREVYGKLIETKQKQIEKLKAQRAKNAIVITSPNANAAKTKANIGSTNAAAPAVSKKVSVAPTSIEEATGPSFVCTLL
jgi:stalled ribosome rescue protein Dom34